MNTVGTTWIATATVAGMLAPVPWRFLEARMYGSSHVSATRMMMEITTGPLAKAFEIAFLAVSENTRQAGIKNETGQTNKNQASEGKGNVFNLTLARAIPMVDRTMVPATVRNRVPSAELGDVPTWP